MIKQRESAMPEDRAEDAGQAVASIAPDDLEAFARDLRTLRGKAGLDYLEMAELSHYEMKTLVSAAGGLRLPTLPVAVAYVRACEGDVTEWEERWQKLAARLAADAVKKPVEPAGLPAATEQPTLGVAGSGPSADGAPVGPPPESEGSGGGEVYVITSAKPRPPAW